MPGPPKQPRTIPFQPGNDPSQRPKRATPEAPQTRAPTCPKWLNSDARAEWKRIMPILQDMGICSTAYRASIAIYCQSYARWKQLEQRIEEDGFTTCTPNGMEIIAPWVSAAEKAKSSVDRAIKSLGLSPDSLQRVAPGSGPEKPDDEYEKFRQEIG